MTDGLDSARRINAGLGDWYVNKEKFPNGLKPLIDKVHSLGWISACGSSRKWSIRTRISIATHPDWVLNFPGGRAVEERQQLVLNLARPDVRDYVLGFLDKLVTENDIAFLKWDYNRNWSEPGWDQLPGAEQKKVYVEFTREPVRDLGGVAERHPGVEIESCSGGGARVDLGILRYTDEVWPSDNTDPLDRLTQQDGFTHAYPVQTMVAWATDSPH